ncbi:hypothetical protein FGO68_gene7985 [Halteria grandinella]|uniref:Uncharacterized protein n=1 Tax=Halteria grandinella TaxID=5974 RepID=A0A8J8ND28_HALGN|nr:hypothetical protein FGO68_gene7985 [Halteria grandinella]
MSPVSHMKQLLKKDVPYLKQQANQTYFTHLTKQQIQLHEKTLKLSRASGNRKPSANDAPYLDPLTYYENRYFPFGFDDPAKVTAYMNKHHRVGSKNPKAAANEDYDPEQDPEQEQGPKTEKTLKYIKDYEKKVDEILGRHIESTIEADFDRRTDMNNETNTTTIGRYKKERKFSTIDSNKSFVEKYLTSSTGLGMGTLTKQLPSKMSKEKHMMSTSLMRGGFSMVSASLPMSPGLNQWAASGNIVQTKTQVLAGVKQGITSGETVLLGELVQQNEAISRAQNLNLNNKSDLKSPTNANPSIQLPEIVVPNLTNTIVDQRNTSLHKLRSDSNALNTSRAFRHSRDMREELINHRIMTQLRLENMNLKVPQTWKNKEEAYHRFKQMKNSMLIGKQLK